MRQISRPFGSELSNEIFPNQSEPPMSDRAPDDEHGWRDLYSDWLDFTAARMRVGDPAPTAQEACVAFERFAKGWLGAEQGRGGPPEPSDAAIEAAKAVRVPWGTANMTGHHDFLPEMLRAAYAVDFPAALRVRAPQEEPGRGEREAEESLRFGIEQERAGRLAGDAVCAPYWKGWQDAAMTIKQKCAAPDSARPPEETTDE